MPGYTDYYFGPIDDDDLVERLQKEFLQTDMRMDKEVFPEPK